MHCHELRTVLPGFRLTLARFERGVRKEFIQRRHLLGRVGRETLCGTDKFHKVLDSRFATFALVHLEKIDKSTGMDDVIDLVLQIDTGGLAGHALDEIQEGEYGVGRATTELIARNCPGGAPHRAIACACVRAHCLDGARPNAPRRPIDDALE